MKIRQGRPPRGGRARPRSRTLIARSAAWGVACVGALILMVAIAAIAGSTVDGSASTSQAAAEVGDADSTADGLSQEATREAARQRDEAVVYVLPWDDAIGPVTATFIENGIEQAEDAGARAIVIQLDTPGGLDASMRSIVKAILAADVPVMVYVSPSGARAASAGVFITMAAPIAAMAPGTNIGAASPVGLGGGAPGDTIMTKKVTQDAMAYVRSIAERHGRNATWAEEAVKEGVSLSAEEAVAQNVVDLIADSLPELLRAVHGREVSTSAGSVLLDTEGVVIERLLPSRRERALALLTHPSVAYLLFLAGILGIGLELYNPGTILPGVVGGIALILAFFALQQLPVNVAGVLLLLLALVLFLLEIKVPSYGILSVGGVTSLVLGSLFLYRSDSMVRVDLSVLVPAVVTVAALFLFAVYMGARAQTYRKVAGAEGMIDRIGEAMTDIDPEGQIFVFGEYWTARAASPILRGSRVRVRAVEGLRLEVEPITEG